MNVSDARLLAAGGALVSLTALGALVLIGVPRPVHAVLIAVVLSSALLVAIRALR